MTPESRAAATIMVVDDTPANLKLLQEMLQSKGYRVLAFPGGRMALAAARRHPPDLILLDITMPDMDGYEVCDQLKADAGLRDIPVLFISALTETTDKVRAFQAGGVDFVTKPFHFDEVNARVKTHLDLRRQRRELGESYQKLQEVEQMRDSLVHMVVHDMRSPLTALMGNLDLALMHQPQDRVREYLVHSTLAVRNLMHMVSSLLDVSRLEEGRLDPVLETVDLEALAREALEMAEPLRGGRHLLLESAEDMFPLVADRQLLLRVLQNLVGNAIKYTDAERGRVVIRLLKRPDGPRVEVCDNGPGIPASHLEKVFDKFCQVEARQHRRPHSSGLGLTFCKLAVELHGGCIGVTSQEGQGSTFWIQLPSVPQAQAAH